MADVTSQDRNVEHLSDVFKPKAKALFQKHPEIFLTEGLRSLERQEYLFSIGRSINTDKPRVTWVDGVFKKSLHQSGSAIDIAFHGGELYPKGMAKWRKVADTAKSLGIDWLYDLHKVDKPHFQCNGKTMTESLKSNYQKIMETEVPKNDRIFTVYDNRDPLVEVKSLIEIGLYRMQKKIIEKLSR